MKVGDDRARRVDPLAAGDHHAIRSAALDGDALYRRAEPHLAARSGDGARKSRR